MIDETDPVVRMIQAPFETTAGDFRRQVRDANASYQEEADKIEQESAKLDAERERILSGRAEEADEEKPAPPPPEFDYDSPLASEQAGSRRWPGTPPSAPSAYQDPAEDQDDPAAARQHRLRHAAWAQPAPEPEPAAQSWAAPPPPPRRTPRPAPRDDEDYSNESWLQ